MQVQTTRVGGVIARGGRRTGGLARQEAIEGYLFILPWILGLLIFTAGPFIAGFYLSFTNFDAMQDPEWVGLANYRRVLGDDPKIGTMLFNTAYYTFVSVPLGVIAGLMLAVLLNQKVRGIAGFRTAYYMPSVVPAVPSVALFIWILHDRFGLLNEFLFNTFGVVGPRWLTSPEWTKPSLILWGLWHVGGGMIIYLAGLQGVPQSLYEAASIDGCGALGRFRHVTLPMISPTLLFVLVMGIIGSFQVFTPVYLLGSDIATAAAGPLDSLLFWVVYVYHNGFFYFRMGYASALAWVLFVIILAITLLQLWLAKRWVYYEAEADGR
ncbi:MAG: sugar ABC transporter permease [Chloroflexi bacterium]|nr:sugar ABC transporter permease [Chloroflexota bacterium]